mgnify:CR=1 FL=1
MVDYSKGRIYKIAPNNGDNICYIGSTTKNLSTRWAQHKNEYKHRKTPKNSKIIFDKYGITNCNIELIEYYKCNTKEELHTREAYHIKNNNSVNKFIPLRTKKEYYEDNKQKINEQRKNFRNTHKELISLQKKKYRDSHADQLKEKINCVCGALVNKSHISRHKRTQQHILEEAEFMRQALEYYNRYYTPKN